MQRTIILSVYVFMLLLLLNTGLSVSIDNTYRASSGDGEVLHSYYDVYNGGTYYSNFNAANSIYKQPYYYPAVFIFYNRPFFLEQNRTIATLKDIGRGILFKPLNNPPEYDPKVAPIVVMDGASQLYNSQTATYLKTWGESIFGRKYVESDVIEYFFHTAKIMTLILPTGENISTFSYDPESGLILKTPMLILYTEFRNGKPIHYIFDPPGLIPPQDDKGVDLVVVLSPASAINYNEYVAITHDYNASWMGTCEALLWKGAKVCVGSLMLPDTFKIGRETYKDIDITYEVPSVFAIPAMQWLERFYGYLAAGDTVEEAANKAYVDTAYYFNTALDLIIEISYIANQISYVLDILDDIMDEVITNIQYLLQISMAIENLEFLLTGDAYSMFYNYVTSTVTSNTITSLVNTLGLTSQSIVYGFMKMLQIKVTGPYGPAIRVYGDLDYRLEPPPPPGGGGGGYPGAPNLPMSENNGCLSG